VKPNETTIKAALSMIVDKIPPPYEGYKENLADILNAPGRYSYPMVAVSHIIVWKSYREKAKEDAVKGFVKWILTVGQEKRYIVDGYVGLPKELTEKLLKEVGWE